MAEQRAIGNVIGSSQAAGTKRPQHVMLVVTSGTLTLQATSITDYDGATKTATVVALTSAPSAADTAVLT